MMSLVFSKYDKKKENNRIVTPCPPSKFVDFIKFDGNPDFSDELVFTQEK